MAEIGLLPSRDYDRIAREQAEEIHQALRAATHLYPTATKSD